MVSVHDGVYDVDGDLELLYVVDHDFDTVAVAESVFVTLRLTLYVVDRDRLDEAVAVRLADCVADVVTVSVDVTLAAALGVGSPPPG